MAPSRDGRAGSVVGTQPQRFTTGPRFLVALLTVSIFINYIDRSNLSVGAPLIQRELHYSVRQIASLSSAFFWTYSLLQLLGISGWVSDRCSVGKVFAWAFLLWSVATAASGMVSSFSAFFAMRLLLGAGESLAYPCYSRMIAMNVPQTLRGRANALLDAGSKLGPSLGTFLGGIWLEHYGWRTFFIVLGVTGMVWLPLWIKWMPRTPSVQCEIVHNLNIWQLFRHRSAWGTFGGHFFGNYFWFFLLIWLPSYLVNDRGLSMQRMATLGAIAYLVIAGATLTAGWISDKLLKGGMSVTRVRKTIVMTGLTVSAVIVFVPFIQDLRSATILLYSACIGFGTYTSNHWVITQTLAGPIMAGRWTSVQNGIGNFSGIVASWATGILVERTGSFRLAFITAACVALVAAMMWGYVVGSVKEVDWRQHEQFA